jgi:hypothetical protein
LVATETMLKQEQAANLAAEGTRVQLEACQARVRSAAGKTCRWPTDASL